MAKGKKKNDVKVVEEAPVSMLHAAIEVAIGTILFSTKIQLEQVNNFGDPAHTTVVIRVQLIGDEKRPVEVRIERILGEEDVFFLNGGRMAVVTDTRGDWVDEEYIEEGSVLFRNLPLGEYRLELYHPTREYELLRSIRRALKKIKHDMPEGFSIDSYTPRERQLLRDGIEDVFFKELGVELGLTT